MLSEKNAHNGENGVKANEVGEGERAHGHVGAQLHGRVNVLASAEALPSTSCEKYKKYTKI